MTSYKRINQLDLDDRPREKMLRKGAAALSDFELLEVCIGSGSGSSDVGYIARQIQRLLEKQGSDALTYDNLTSIKGVSVATAGKLLAALELVQRHLLRDSTPLLTQRDILSRVSNIRNKQQEYFVSLSLDGGQRLIALRTVAIGTLDTVVTHPREVFSDPVADRAASIVVVHNHPSGSPKPSRKDVQLTQQLSSVGQMLGITLKDHIIVTRNEHYSFQQHHLL
ncbi:MAG TPA: DNA repair protein RadC [Patescibacteria group bacterium]|nr:DNA repair protein RadC [Patescibacteria group bacterium]